MQFEKQRAFRTMQRTVVERHVLESLIQSAHEEEELNRNQYARQLGNPVHVGEARRLPRHPPLGVLCLVVRTPLFFLSAAVLRVTTVRGARRTVPCICVQNRIVRAFLHTFYGLECCVSKTRPRARQLRVRVRGAPRTAPSHLWDRKHGDWLVTGFRESEPRRQCSLAVWPSHRSVATQRLVSGGLSYSSCGSLSQL